MYLVHFVCNNDRINENDPFKHFVDIPLVGDEVEYGYDEVAKRYRVEKRIFDFSGMAKYRDTVTTVEIRLIEL